MENEEQDEVKKFAEEQAKILQGKRPHKYTPGCECPWCEATRARQRQYSKQHSGNRKKDIAPTVDIQPSKEATVPTVEVEEPIEQVHVSATPKSDTVDNKVDAGGDAKAKMMSDLSRFSETNHKEEKPTETKEANAEVKFDVKPTVQQYNEPRPSLPLSDFITGAMFLMVLDEVFPVVVKYVIGFFNKKYQRLNDAGEAVLKLDEKETAKLEPMADKLAAVIFIQIPPEWIFIIAWGIISMKKLSKLKPEHFDKPEKNDN